MKQFTLLELILAVVATALGTTLVALFCMGIGKL